MSEKLNELNPAPQWVHQMSYQEQYKWYLLAKQMLPTLGQLIDTSSLELAISDYEKRMKQNGSSELNI